MNIERIISRGSNEVSVAFGYDGNLVKKFRKALRAELRIIPAPKRRLIARVQRAQARYTRANFRATILEKALSLGIRRLEDARIDHDDLARVMRISARLSQRAPRRSNVEISHARERKGEP